MDSGKLKIMVLAVTLAVTANFVLGSPVFAKKLEMNSKDIERIKTSLSLTKALSNFIITDDKFRSILNMVIKGGQVGTDVTYGLFVLTSLNEMEFIDMVVSQRFKAEAREYFNGVLDERLSLIGYYKGIGYDLPRILTGKITGPTAALTLNSFEITDKVINVFIAFNLVKEVKLYDGLRIYFDDRRNNESHSVAWDDAKEMMSWAVFNNPFGAKQRNEQYLELESKYAELWNAWGLYTDSNGIKKEFKEQIKNELADTLAIGIENQQLAEKEKKPSFWESAKLAIKGWSSQLGRIGYSALEWLSQLSSRLRGFTLLGRAQISQVTQTDIEEELDKIETEIKDQETKEESQSGQENTGGPKVNLDEVQEMLDDITESIDILTAETAKLILSKPLDESEEEIETQDTKEEIDEENVEDSKEEKEPALCQKTSYAGEVLAILNEIAWMGSQNSSNDEWIELKNMTREPLSLAGWQIQDKDQQVQVVFTDKDQIAQGSFYLLERSNDDSVPAIAADFIYKGSLANANEELYLFDDGCRLQDEILANPDWPAGDNSSKGTMERKDDLGWQTSIQVGGTPRAANGSGYSGFSGGASPPPPSPAPSPLPLPEEMPSPQILITEIQIENEFTADNDFVELYNPNIESVDVSDWQLKKKTSTGNESSVRVFPDNSIIPAQGYFIWLNSDYAASSSIEADATSSQTLAKNNSVALFDDKEIVVDEVAWGTSTDSFMETSVFPDNPSNKNTLGRKWSTTSSGYIDTDNNAMDFELQDPTPKSQNQIPGPEPQPEPEVPMLTVVINEIAWMGTNSSSSSDEWVELYNNTTSTVDLTGWRLIALDNSPNIIFPTSTIPANSFYLIERTDDTTIGDIQADWSGSFGTGGLSNSGEKLELRDAQGNLIDAIDASLGWFSGTTTPVYISMERINSNVSGSDFANWASNNLITRNGFAADNRKINGTPKSVNSVSMPETQFSNLPFEEFDEIVLTYLGSPYTALNTLIVPENKRLTVEPGVVLKFYIPETYGPGEGSSLIVRGGLEAVGQPGKEIVFTSTGNLWPGAVFEGSDVETSFSSRLEYVRVEKARGWDLRVYPIMKIIKKSVLIKNSLLEYNSNVRGLIISDSSSTIDNVSFSGFNGPPDLSTAEYPSALFIQRGSPTIKNSSFSNNYYGVVIEAEASCYQNPDFQIMANNFSQNTVPVYITNYGLPCFDQNQIVLPSKDGLNNVLDGILIKSMTFSTDNLWQSDSPLIVDGSLSVGNATFTVAAGTTVKFKSSTSAVSGGMLNINSGGRLVTQGEIGNIVSFTSANENPRPGDWQSIYFQAGSGGELNFTKISYGGFGLSPFRNSCLVINSMDVVLNGVEKEYCEPYQ